MKSTRLKFDGSRGTELAAILNLPDRGKPRSYALFAHCFTCSKDFKAAVNIARALTDRDMAILRFDFTGIGDSKGEFSETTFSSNVEDMAAAAAFMAEKYEPPGILIGHSFGGAAAIQAAARIKSCQAVAVIAAPYDPSHIAGLLNLEERFKESDSITVNIAGRQFKLRKKFLEDIKDERLKKTLGRLQCPLIIFHSPQDNIVGIENAGRIFKAAVHPKSFISLDGADHVLSDPADSAYVGYIIAEWAARYL